MKHLLTRTNLRELSLRPYPGSVFVTKDRKAFERAARELLDTGGGLTTQTGRFLAGPSWYHPHTAIVWYTHPASLVHELGHVVLDLFETIGCDPVSGGGEPFCYMLAQLFEEATEKGKKC